MTHSSLFRSIALLGAVAGASIASTTPARAASIADCGNINVEADAKCQVSGGCEVQCTPIAFEAMCSAELHANCATSCSKLPEVSCTGSCEADCSAQCTVKPAEFDCEGSCTGKCEGTCDAKCSSTASGGTTNGGASADAKGECMASCKSTCSGECHGSCTGTPATADCAGKCKASCSGSCKADLNMDCQTTCQAKGYADCESSFTGHCTADCSKKVAVFCNGQYIDHGGHADSCITALNRYLKSKVTATGSASSSCANGVCEAQAEGHVSTKCSVAAPGRDASTTGAGGAALTALLGIAAAMRRRRS